MLIFDRARTAHLAYFAPFALSLLLLGEACTCDQGDPEGRTTAPLQAATSAAPASGPTPNAIDPTRLRKKLPGERLRIHDPAALAAYDDLTAVRDLDLALSDEDRLGVAAADDPDPCAALELRHLASRLPELRRLRLSGCQAAVHTGLDAFATVDHLELVDLTLDGVTMGRLLALPTLRSLTLTRVTAGSESLTLLRDLPIADLTLRELTSDSPLVSLIGLLASLRTVTLEGPWAGHREMLAVAKGRHLEGLTLRRTEVGNFSLNQVKGLQDLATLELVGTAFNDKTPLYLRNLPLTRFACDCPNLGEAGLRSLRHLKGLRHLKLRGIEVPAAALDSLGALESLESLHFHGHDLGPAGFAALTAAPGLRELHLEVAGEAPRDPSLTGLGGLTGLRRLTLRSDAFDDQIAGELATLHKLEELDLGGTAISDRSLAAVAAMPELRHLALHHTRVTNRGLEHLAGLAHLEVLELDHTDVVDAGVAHLRGLKNLRELRLDATLITDAALETLGTLDRLERLNLAETVVTTAGLDHLRGLPRLRSVNLEGTRATAP